jgi:hypothetical protein
VRGRGAAAIGACLLLAGCGGTAGDLMAIEVEGGVASARGPLDIVVQSDGRGECNDRPSETVPSDLVLDTRELERDLKDLAESGARFPARGAKGAHFVVRIKAGTIRWDEKARGLPTELRRAQLIALRLDRLLCR